MKVVQITIVSLVFTASCGLGIPTAQQAKQASSNDQDWTTYAVVMPDQKCHKTKGKHKLLREYIAHQHMKYCYYG